MPSADCSVRAIVGKLDGYRVLALSILALPLDVVSLPLAGFSLTGAIVLAICHAVPNTALMVSYNAAAYGLLAAFTPDEKMGRRQGIGRVFTMGPVPTLGIVGGLTGDAIHPQPAMWIWVELTFIAALPLLVLRRTGIRKQR